MTFGWGIIATAALLKWCDDSKKAILDMWGVCVFLINKVEGGK